MMEETPIYSRVIHKVVPWFTQKLSFNYSYYALFFFLLLAVNVVSILTVEQGSYEVKAFFLLYDVGQVVVEFIGIVLLSIVLKKYAPNRLYKCYIGCIFVLLLLQCMEAALVKIMDISLAEGLHIAFAADLKNFFELLRLSDIGMGTWSFLFALIILFPFFGVFLYKAMEKISVKKPVVLRLNALLVVLCVIPVILSVTDGCVFNHLVYADYSAYKKALPWKTTFLKVPKQKLSMQGPLKAPRNDPAILNTLALYHPHLAKKPNIYLFVVESLRSDYLTQETAPNLMAFKKAHIAPKEAFSNANHTITSWFSIFHSSYPFYWAYSKNPSFKQGSLPLHVLKQLGYKVHIYSSAQLKYYDFDQVLLGKDLALADTLTLAPHYGDISSSDSDTRVMNSFHKDIQQHSKEGNLYVFFLDSTHFNYSWPQDFPQKFTPADEVTWKHRLSNNLDVLKNRYKNSIAFVDHLFGNAVQILKNQEIYDESIIIFCGDHGEEFKEDGKLFHASHLSTMQMRIPLFYKFGKSQANVAISSHIDIFPSIIDYIDRNNRFLSYMDGDSIFGAEQPSFAVVARYNSCSHPYEFYLSKGSRSSENVSLLARFNKKNNIFRTTSIQVLESYQGDKAANFSQEEIESYFQKPLKTLFPDR